MITSPSTFKVPDKVAFPDVSNLNTSTLPPLENNIFSCARIAKSSIALPAIISPAVVATCNPALKALALSNLNLISSSLSISIPPPFTVIIPAKVVSLPLTVIGALPKVSESVTEPAPSHKATV